MLRFFRSHQIFDSVLNEMKSVFQKMLSMISAKGKRVLRVLEIGAGKPQNHFCLGIALMSTPGNATSLTSCLCEVLQSLEDVMVEYVASDPILAMAQDTILSIPYEHIFAQAYNVSRDPEEQGLKQNSFDIIVGFNTLHITPDVNAAISRLNRLLVPGGLLLMTELDGTSWKEKPGSIWINCVFGIFQEWFCHTDERERNVLTSEEWILKLKQTGYDNAQALGSEDGGLMFVFTAQSSGTQDATNVTINPKTLFFPYRYGNEMALQRELSELDINEPWLLWLITEDGIDGHAGLGLVQSVMREFASWDIRLAIFEATLEKSEQVASILRCFHQLGDNTVVRFTTDGRPLVPKVVKTLPPPDTVDFDRAYAWISSGSNVTQVHLGPLGEYQSLVEISAWSTAVSSFRGFMGSIVDSRNGAFTLGQKVIGISQSPLTNRIICHSGHLSALPDTIDGDHWAGYALPVVIATLILNPARMAKVGLRSPGKRICIAEYDNLGRALQDVLEATPLLASLSFGDPSRDSRFDLVIASSSTLAARPEIRSWRGRLFIWDKAVGDLLNGDPWLLGDTLQSGIQYLTPATPLGDSHVIYPRNLISGTIKLLASNSHPLFDAKKAYILLGGVSDLGIHVAMWMYQVRVLHP
jgi:SAM-dependent methyltransferase